MATINTVFKLSDEMSPALRTINTNLGSTLKSVIGVNQAIMLLNTTIRAIKKVASAFEELGQVYDAQYEQEVKLYTVMQQRMGATRQDLDSVKALAKEYQNLGIYSDQMILKGAQELATFVETREQLEELIPTLVNLTAQQYGFGASAENMRQTATLLGKMINGTTLGLNRLGIKWTEQEEKLRKNADLNTRIAMTIEKITQKVGDMNEALGMTYLGKMAQLQNQLIDIKEAAGELVQPLRLVALQIKVAFATKMLEIFNRWITWVKTHIEEAKRAFVKFATLSIQFLAVLAIAWVALHWKMVAVILILSAIGKLIVDVSGGSENALKTTIGMVAVLGAVLYNMFANVYNNVARVYNNVFVPIWNMVADLVNAVVGGVDGMLTHIAHPIKSFISDVLGWIEPLIKAWDWLFKTDYSKQFQEMKKQWEPKSVIDWRMEEKQKLEYQQKINYKDAYNAGAEAGEKLQNGINTIANTIENFSIDYPELPKKNGAVSVYDEALVDIADDYRELLTRRATERFNLQFARVSPTITIEKVDVRREADADNVLHMLVNTMDEFANSSLSVAYGGGGGHKW